MKTVSVSGLGYIGLPTAAVFADAGLDVIGVDVSEHAVEAVNQGRPHIVEPNLEALLRRVVEAGKLRATLTPAPADVYIIAVPTPFRDGREPDLSYVEAAARALAPTLSAGALVILESTSPVGATERVAEWLREERPDLTFPQQAGDLSDIRIAHCPERVLPGRVLHEVVNNPRIIGGLTRRCSSAAATFYQIVVTGEVLLTDAKTAELAKLVENAYRDVNIAFANELSLICDRLRINVWELISLANKHPRVNILQPGPGVGGHCIAVDPWFIVHTAPDLARITALAREVNDSKPDWVVERTLARARELRDPRIACFGLSYKPNIDDLRESPAIEIVRALGAADVGEVMVCEPHLKTLPDSLRTDRIRLEDFNRALETANVLVFLVGHDVFKNLDRSLLQERIIIDSCGLLES